MELLGRRPRGRPNTRYMGVVREDMKLVGAREHDAAVIRLWGFHNHSSSPEGIFTLMNEPTESSVFCLFSGSL